MRGEKFKIRFFDALLNSKSFKNIKALILSIFAGLSSGLSFNLPFLSAISWFSFVPLFFILKARLTKSRIFLYFYGGGFTFFFTVLFWVGYVTKLGFISLIIYLSLYWAVFGALSLILFNYRSMRILLIPSLWVTLEVLREYLFGGFGWALLGYSQFKNLYIIQIADLLGIEFISFLMMMVNLSVFEFIEMARNGALRVKRNYFKFGLPLSLILVSLAYSWYEFKGRYDYREGSLRVRLIQPNIPQDIKWHPRFKERILDVYRDLIKDAPLHALVIFPEASFPYILDKDNLPLLSNFAEEAKRDILMGAIFREGDNFYNTSLLIDREGEIKEVYRKIKLVPFGEYVPFRRFLGFIKVINVIGDTTPGREFTVFDYKGRRFAVLVCFEDIFPSLVQNFSSRKVDFFINITNDAWFRGYPQSLQHLSILVARSIENRRFFLRSANSGISCLISPQGRILTRIVKGERDVFVRGVLDVKVPLTERKTFYWIGRNLFILFSLILSLVFYLKGKRLPKEVTGWR